MTKSKYREVGFNQVEYQNKYNKDHYDRFCIVFPKGSKELIKERAKKSGLSISKYLLQASDFYESQKEKNE